MKYRKLTVGKEHVTTTFAPLTHEDLDGNFDYLDDKINDTKNTINERIDNTIQLSDTSDLPEGENLYHTTDRIHNLLQLEYDETIESIIPRDLGPIEEAVETFELSTPVDITTLNSDMSIYELGQITVDNGVDAPYVLPTSDYTYADNVITFNTPILDGQISNRTETYSVTYDEVGMDSNTGISIGPVPDVSTVEVINDNTGSIELFTSDVITDTTETFIYITNAVQGSTYTINWAPSSDLLKDQDGTVTITVQLLPISRYASLGSSDKPFKDIYGTVIGTISSIENHTTSNLAEGETNLYYTDTRVADYLTTNSYAQEDWVTNQITTLTGTVTELTTTDGITEGTTNLYYTDDRVRSAISVEGSLSYDSVTGVLSYTDPATIDWASVENKPTTVSGYGITDTYTQSETDAAITTRVTEIAAGEINLTGYATEAYADTTIDSKTTDDLSEGETNLYYTDARVISALGANNIPNEDWVISTVTSSLSGDLFAEVALTGNYSDLLNVPVNLTDFNNDTNYISLTSLSGSGDIAYDNTTGIISFTQDKSYDSLTGVPTNVSHLNNDSNYLIDSDIRNEFTAITDRLDILETPVYTVFDFFRNIYDNTPYTVSDAMIEFRIRAIDNIRFVFLGSGQEDPTWDTMVTAIYDNNVVAFTEAYNSVHPIDKADIQLPYLMMINADVLLIKEAFNKNYDTLTREELLNTGLLASWQERNAQMFDDANTFNNSLPTASDTIKNILLNNSYADFTRDTVVTGWNPT